MIVKCKYCNQDFDAKRITASFCSDVHRSAYNKLSEEEKNKLDLTNEALNKIVGKENMLTTQKTKLVITKENRLEEKPSDASMEKIRALHEKLNKQFGAGTVMFLGDKPSQKIEVIPTGSLTLDDALGIGGLPRGRIIEIYGVESSGKTTLALHVIKNAQKMGLKCLLVDAENSFDPEYADSIGLDVDKLQYCQPSCGEEALEIADNHVASGDVGVVVIDSVAALVPKAEIEGAMGDSKMGLQARLMSQACRKMVGSISRTNSLVIFINQLRDKIGVTWGNPEITTGGKALQFYASVRLDVRKMAQIKDGEVSVGSRTKVKVTKNKCAPPHKTAEFDIMYGVGVDNIGEIIDLSIAKGIIIQKGAWFFYGENQLGQGRSNVRKMLTDNEGLTEEIKNKISEAK